MLIKTTESIELSFSDISEKVSSFTNNMAIGASIARYHTVKKKYQDYFDNYIQERMSNIVKENYHIDEAICFTNDRRIYKVNNTFKVDKEKFYNGEIYNQMVSAKKDELWFNVKPDWLVSKDKKIEEEKLIIARKIYHIIPEGSKEDKAGMKDYVVGYILAFINKDKIMELYNKSTLTPDNELAICDEEFEPVIYKSLHTITPNLKERLDYVTKGPVMKELELNDIDYLLGVCAIKPLNWYIASAIPIESLMGETERGVKGSLWIIGFISIIVSIFIIIEILILSRIITDKEMVAYKLNVTQQANEKLRMYKHDFMNHLQIIQGLIQMGQPKRALDYLKRVSNEGKSIHQNYEIGIPELEATINTAINEAKEYGIEVVLDVVKISKELPIKTYDLTKVISNLIKNAIYALIHSNDEHKVLKIKIDYDLGNYVFEVFNNTPIITEDIGQKIFNKGFSTKGKEGDGLGLYIVKKTIEKYGGKIELVVKEDGNHFIITIPDTISE
ncbi:two-component sensor histidine kinase [Caldisalinibacter kiritimatiensis]|uniref:histidine kinase n=1 Tax=Caldisalinibacter kiritimatiensis TaxID=1304284 RepID=R1CS08_9FIRM|nr:two-component sensor histidine kinase [Caldisalinibacter kiritimatiensis]